MKTHPLNVTYLVVGLVFLGIVGSWALHETGVIEGADVGWLVPLSLVIAGGVGLAAAVAKGFNRSGAQQAEPGPAYQPAYDAPLAQDYTSDLDRRLDEQAGSVTTTETTATDTNDPQGENR